jgi:Zn-dependent protease with chaperone function
MAKILLLATLGLLLVGAVAWSGWVWASMPNTELGGHGIAALILGIVGSLVVGCGLMGLVFYSSRRGYDDRVRYDDGDE